MNKNVDYKTLDLKDFVIHVGRVSKVVKGGKRFKFNALVVVGDGHGYVGYALGKAREVPDAVRKATEKAKKSLYKIPLKGTTIPYEVIGEFDAAKVILKPAASGTGVIAGSVIRAVMEALGVHDILTKCIGRTSNPFNVLYATFEALKQLKEPEEILTLRKGAQ